MKKKKTYKIKVWTYLFLEIIFILSSGYVLTLVKEPYVEASLFIWSGILAFSGVITCFFVILEDKGYKLKYFFLGKSFKKPVDEFFEQNTYFSEKEKLFLIKRMKDEYRRKGHVSFILYKRRETVLSLWNKNIHDIYWEKNEEDLTEKEKFEFIIDGLSNGIRYFLYDYGGLKIIYDDFYNIINNCNMFDNECKKYLLSKKFKNIFEFYNNLEKYKEEEIKTFDQENNNYFLKFDKFEENIYEIKENIAVKNYIEYQKFECLPENVVNFFISKEGKERLYVFFDKSLNVYRVAQEIFTFYYYDIPLMDNEGGWNHVSNSYSSLFETQEIALNDIKERTKDFEEISVDKIKM